ncbi:hypothetical protein GCM10011578_053870 [Streptomyces fuscichromogenes]|uniref:Uncharacterized protein n=1 Tax=Streptomyces fuscichromogenes TaxID=1324013 RepID=A0A917XGZ4_9ACTN|nr:hypothetical protein GCM10011578_053870 [Streptomyces fuscichromogenes]
MVQRAEREAVGHQAEIPNRDWSWGTATARQRLVHRLGTVSQMTADGSELNGLGRLAAAIKSAMLTRWPALQPLPRQRP